MILMEFTNPNNDFLKFLSTNKDLTIYEKTREGGLIQKWILKLRTEKVLVAQFLDLLLWSNSN